MGAAGLPVMGDLLLDWFAQLGVGCILVPDAPGFAPLLHSLRMFGPDDRMQVLTVSEERHCLPAARGFARATGLPVVAMVSSLLLPHLADELEKIAQEQVPVVLFVAGADTKDNSSLPSCDISWIERADDLPEMLGHAVSRACLPPAGAVCVICSALFDEPAKGGQKSRNLQRYVSVGDVHAEGPLVNEICAALHDAERLVILMGRVGLDEASWHARLALADTTGASIITDIGGAGVFPEDHPGHLDNRQAGSVERVLNEADVILSLGWGNLAQTLERAFGANEPEALVIHVAPQPPQPEVTDSGRRRVAPVDIFAQSRPEDLVTAFLGDLSGVAHDPAPCEPNSSMGVRRAIETSLGHDRLILMNEIAPDTAMATKERLDRVLTGAEGRNGALAVAVGIAAATVGDGRLPVVFVDGNEFRSGLSALATAKNVNAALAVVLRSGTPGRAAPNAAMMAAAYGIPFIGPSTAAPVPTDTVVIIPQMRLSSGRVQKKESDNEKQA